MLIIGVGVTLAGMAWLSRVGADSSYLTAVALPMVLIGIGQGLAFAPMTSAGLAGVDTHDAGAASGLINTFHQLGSALGLGILATVGAAAVPAGPSGVVALVDRVSAALTGGTIMLAVALLAVLVLIARRGTTRLRSCRSSRPSSAYPSEPFGNYPADQLPIPNPSTREGRSCEQQSSTVPATSASRPSQTRSSNEPTDAVVRIVRACICGSDLHPYHQTAGDRAG